MRFLLAAALLLIPVSVRADCAADLKAVYDMASAVRTFRTETLTEGGGGTTGMFILPEKFLTRTPAGEMMMIGSGVWLKEEGAWTRLPAQFTPAAAAILRSGFAAGFDGVKNVHCLEPVDIAGRSYRVFRFDSEGKFMGAASTEQVTLYVDPDTRLPVRQEITTTVMGTPATTVQSIAHDRSVSIVMPRSDGEAAERSD